MPYMKIRISLFSNDQDDFTYDPSNVDHTQDKMRHRLLLNKFIREKKEELGDYTLGFERQNKYGEPCRPHFHFHFYWSNPQCCDPKRTITRWFQTRAAASEIPLRGPRKWCVQLVDDPQDENRFYRYPFKFGLISRCSTSFPNEWLDLQIPIAVDENRRRIEANCLHRDKVMDKQTFRDKLFIWLDKPPDGENPKTHASIWIAILLYYQQEGKPINFQTIDGYTTLYQLHIGTLTPIQAYSMRSKSPD